MKYLLTMLPLMAAAEAVNVVSMNVARNPVTQGKIMNPRGLGKRATVTESLINNVTAGSYLATVKIGTPAQTMTLALDTGSSDVWVLSNAAIICEESQQSFEGDGGCSFGTFNANKSSTFKDILPGGFEIQYQDNTGAEGDYFTDDLTFGSATVKNLQMGLGAGQTTVNLGIMGIGYDTNEAAIEDGESKYPNIIDQLVSQNLINIEAYSLYLDDLFQSSGSILFGGIDQAKYTGSLISVPIQPDGTDGTTVSSFTVALTSVAVKNGSTTTTISNETFPVILDSGTTLTYLPDELADQIYATSGAIDDTENSGAVFIDCNSNSSGATFNYQFGGTDGPTISVAIAELLIEIPNEELEASGIEAPFQSTCQFGIFPGGEGPFLLGDTFLRSAYVVYDLKNDQIGLAQSSFNIDSSNVMEIQASASGIPLVSGVATGVSVTQTATGVPGVGGTKSTGSSTMSATLGSTTSASGSSLSTTTSTASSVSGSGVVSSSVSVSSTSSLSSSSKSSSGTASSSSSSSSSKSGSQSRASPLDFGGLAVLTVSGLCSLMSGIWFVL